METCLSGLFRQPTICVCISRVRVVRRGTRNSDEYRVRRTVISKRLVREFRVTGATATAEVHSIYF